MISPLDRRKLLSTFNAQEIGQIRAALQRAGVEFTIKQDSHPVGGTGYGNVTSAITLGAGAAPFEYTVYVHKDDFALAESLYHPLPQAQRQFRGVAPTAPRPGRPLPAQVRPPGGSTRRATTGRPYGWRAESSRPTDRWFRGKRADDIRPYGPGS